MTVPTDERRVVPIDEAIRRIGDGEYVHTFVGGGSVLVGADHERDFLIGLMREYGVEESGPTACSMKHTLCIVDRGGLGPLWIEAAPAEEAVS